jgi:hypothetical protein
MTLSEELAASMTFRSILSDNVQRTASLLRTPAKSSLLVGGLALLFKTTLHSSAIMGIAGSNIFLVAYTFHLFKYDGLLNLTHYFRIILTTSTL